MSVAPTHHTNSLSHMVLITLFIAPEIITNFAINCEFFICHKVTRGECVMLRWNEMLVPVVHYSNETFISRFIERKYILSQRMSHTHGNMTPHRPSGGFFDKSFMSQGLNSFSKTMKRKFSSKLSVHLFIISRGHQMMYKFFALTRP